MAVKIISGKYRGMQVESVKGAGTRPTAIRTREALFSILEAAGALRPDSRIMDICAGTGALGIECLSRTRFDKGALDEGGIDKSAFCLFIEQNPAACAVLAKNIEHIGIGDASQIMRRDAMLLRSRPQSLAPFSLVFIDPPYNKNIAARVLRALKKGMWLESGAMIIVEEDKRAPKNAVPDYQAIDERLYGDTRISFYNAH